MVRNGFYLITGTSKGIGQALAHKILEKGNSVLGVSRSRSDVLGSPNYTHLSYDLADTAGLYQIMEAAIKIVHKHDFDFLCLVNNASAVEPIKPIERCSPMEIESHIKIGLIAPMILTSLFMREFSEYKSRKKVVFISSGSASTPMPDMSVYCSAKAAAKIFVECVGLEQEKEEDGLEIISVSPGMVDTPMQRAARSKTTDQFAMAGFFKGAYEDGRLQEPGKVAEKIYTILENKYDQGVTIPVSQVSAG